jgi:glycine/D-amino acid oxidase-like deaminating enzyme
VYLRRVRIAVVGAGIFGVTAALELARRGHAVQLLDPGPIPHPLAASTDVSKVVRLEYGSDEDYLVMMEEALDGWRRWNRDLGEELFHESGVLFLRRTPMAPGTFEGDSFAQLRRRGHAPEELDAAALAARFPAWRVAAYPYGFFHAQGGWVESGRVVARLAAEARARGVEVHEGRRCARLVEESGHVTGVQLDGGERLDAERVIVAAGSWTHHLLPSLAPHLRSNGMPVFHLRPADPAPFRAGCFPVFGADISATGYYGFPLHPTAGVVKIANHGAGRAMSAAAMEPGAPERTVTDEETARLRAFLADAFPALAAAPIVHTRVCVYSDTWDGHFWIAADPARPGLVVAAGGSGHAYKFAPLLGGLIADAADGVASPRLAKFRWRPEVHPARTEEEARLA